MFQPLLDTVRDHPRACGEQPNLRRIQRTTRGSPPRMRGTGSLGVNIKDKPGITPAHAGNSSPRGLPSVAGEDHPRACGEQQKPKKPNSKP